ncbi:aminopeptidase N-like [Carassius auratus]|uniref:Aminopeptidase n=1 Tax=Carassius auratus TaxID=7957 RepID=A0A6P6KI71_CARAU|nr:aminopeptidase N-like [Carassius auratus]
MGKGFYISRPLGFVLLGLGVVSVLTIFSLSVVYTKEKRRNEVKSTNGTQAVTTAAPYSTPAPSNEPWDKYRLPDTLLPKYYNVTLWPRLVPDEHGMYIFNGKSGVAFTCVKETNLIIIHSNKLNLTLTSEKHHATLSGLGGTSAPGILKTWFQTQTQFMVIQLKEKLQVGKSYWLYMEFHGELSDDLEGFYKSQYTENGVKKVVATTQMQPTAARNAFPCFDEPSMKAVFHLTLLHPPGTVALANGMELGTERITIDSKEVLQTRFEPTQKMSTYLLAFIVSEFTKIQSPLEANVLIRIWGRREAIESGHGDYALNVTFPILKFLEKYYNTTYPLSKSDQVALPDFAAGAMENWGLVTYREQSLFYDPKVSSNEDKEWVVTVIAHELAHMWFGNLVTMRWWNDLWLNEGFASYVSYLGADYAEPTWNIKELMVQQQVQRAFAVDSLVSSHPLSSREDEIITPDQISQLFDTITYSKGAAVLRMLSEFLTESVFAKGLHYYLQEYAFSNTVYTDLWKKLQEVVDADSGIQLPDSVNEIMNRWILQMGFPVVTIDTRTGSISQQHFLIHPEAVVYKPSDYNYEWIVPIKWMKNGQNMGQHWLRNKTASYEPMKTETDWLLANLNVTGYYRVNYDPQNWERLLKQLTTNHKIIPVLNRGQIIDDAFNLARAQIISITLALRTTEYLYEEKEYIPWESAISNLQYFFLMFDRTEVYGPLQSYLRRKVQPLFDHFKVITSNWTQKPPRYMDQYNQVNAILMACKTGVKGCSELTSMWYRQWMKNPDSNPIAPNLKTTVYCTAIAAGGVEEWDFGWQMFRNCTIAAEARKLLFGLSCTRESWLLNRYLEFTTDPNLVRKQDVTSAIVYISGNVIGQPLVWDFIRANWKRLTEDYDDGFFFFGRLIQGITKKFSTKFELQQLQRFKEDIEASGFSFGMHAIEQAIEQTKANVKWVSENKANVMNWLTQQSA